MLLPLPILYSFRRCPYAIRARLAIRAAGVPVALREVVLRSKPAELLAASPKGTVPVLVLPDGTVLDQSLDIMRWALAQHDPLGWLQPEEADEAHALIDLNDQRFKPLLDAYKYAPERAAASRDEAVALMLAPLEQRLLRHSHLLRDTASLADMALLPFVRQFAAVDAAWFAAAPLPKLQAWLQRLTGAGLFESVMAKYAPWQAGDDAPVFGR
ncbi:glutathione S-transferase N-terminal domain-containing protein [Aquincola sp. J276]|uniref:glutathione S-transferase N-terminal domain-containing protein n=1 Tax=Aquincola sp. J276 TaxID=2898432 RepID=UPI002151C680|nr:glutathione S-transferase N-terminal domain-containing protein [Aquincola sp. J276]MCR5869120.1 glutathione S-transferase N-terminal domain-containing protein [Aquincola sp. J276]